MMNILEEAIIYATILHQGKVRKFRNMPFILHPMEVAQILSTMTDDQEIIAAGILHDVVEGTDGTIEEIEKRFGKRVASLVSSGTETEVPGESRQRSWKRRKEDSLLILQNSTDPGIQMLWLADKLSNIRSLSGIYSECGEELWSKLNESDPGLQRWYYRSIAEAVELTLNKTGAFKELIKHINFIWPGTFDSEKARYKKYREVSVDGCRLLGRGAKGEVYRYDDELVIKVYNQNNTYRDVEQEIASCRRAFVLGIPTAISFGIVSVGSRYGAMFELVDSDTISSCIAKNPGQVEYYAGIMAELAHTIHSVEVEEKDGFPSVKKALLGNISGGAAYFDEALGEKCRRLADTLPDTCSLVHGDFHTGNVFLQNGEPLLIDMDRVSRGQPIVEIGDMYMFYVAMGEHDPSVIEKFMGFSYETSKRFFDAFLRRYLGTDDEDRLREVTEKAAFLCYLRMIRRTREKGKEPNKEELIADYLKKAAELAQKLDSLA